MHRERKTRDLWVNVGIYSKSVVPLSLGTLPTVIIHAIAGGIPGSGGVVVDCSKSNVMGELGAMRHN